MISILHLIWIIPVSMAAGFVLCCMVPEEHDKQTCLVDREELKQIVREMEQTLGEMKMDRMYDGRREEWS